MFVFMDESVEAVASVDTQLRDGGWVGDRLNDNIVGTIEVVAEYR